MAPLFVVSAILSGTALVTLLALAAERFGRVDWPQTRESGSAASSSSASSSTSSSWVPTTSPHCGATSLPTAPHSTSCCRVGLVVAVLGRVDSRWGHPPRPVARSSVEETAGLARAGGAPRDRGVFIFRIELVVIGFINPLTQYPPGNALGTYNPRPPHSTRRPV